MRPTQPEPRSTASLPVVSIRTGFLAGLRRRPKWTMTVRRHDGALLARRSFGSFQEAVECAHTVCRAAAGDALQLAA
ncbi:hypothetical protein [Kocuria palustris]|uniref:hypothetical protein n=1 Tax=Kocuria palustris TaxID=71999 RepID=UPI00119EA8F2|nr:hypothetical protein [Kocuria palustris]